MRMDTLREEQESPETGITDIAGEKIPVKKNIEGRQDGSCPFCNPESRYIILSNSHSYARWDINPVSKGHVLIIPFRHVPDFFETAPDERTAIMALVSDVRLLLEQRYHPAGYNFGVNIGEAAGQRIMHVHFHLIPRYRGDTNVKPNGMRNVIPKPQSWQRKLNEFFPLKAPVHAKRVRDENKSG
jgi:diadenosine tetraphosphate (Ap4A) HIT family hydrolase